MLYKYIFIIYYLYLSFSHYLTLRPTHPLPNPPLTWVKVAEGVPIPLFHISFDVSVKGVYDNEACLQKKQQRWQTGAQTGCVLRSH